MKKTALITLLIFITLLTVADWRQYWNAVSKNDKFGVAMPIGQLVYSTDSNAWYRITHLMTKTDSMATVFRLGYYVKVAGGSGGGTVDTTGWNMATKSDISGLASKDSMNTKLSIRDSVSEYSTIYDYTRLNADVLTFPAKNKFNPSGFINEYYFDNSNGSLQSSGGPGVFNCSGYQSVIPGKKYVLWNSHADGLYNSLILFDKNRNYISTLWGTGDVYILGKWYITIPYGCYYIGINSKLNPTQSCAEFSKTVQLEEGTVATDFESYRTVATVVTDSVNKYNSSLRILKNGTDVYIRSSYNPTKDLIQKLKVNTTSAYESINVCPQPITDHNSNPIKISFLI